VHPSASTICTSREILSFGYNTVEYWKWSYWFTPTVHSHNFGQFIPATYLVTSYPAPIYSYSSNHSIYTTNHKSMQSTNQPVNQSINQSITLYQLSDHLSTYQSITISINQSIYLSVYVCLSVYLSTYLSVCLSVSVCLHIYIHPSMWLFVRLSTYPAAKFHDTKEQNFFTKLTASNDQENPCISWNTMVHSGVYKRCHWTRPGS